MNSLKSLLRRREPQDYKYQKKKLKVVFSIITIFIILLLIVINIELPLPEDEQGIKTARGKIISCEIERIGKGITAQLYVGIQLSSMNESPLKLNAPLHTREKYESMCDKKMEIRVTYHANRFLIRPEITYVIDSIEINQTRDIESNYKK